MIDRSNAKLSLSAQCRVLSLNRASLYYRPKGESPETLKLMRRIDELFMAYPFYDSRQMVRHLAREGVCVGRHRVRRLMRKMGLQAIYQVPRTSQPASRAQDLSLSAQELGDHKGKSGIPLSDASITCRAEGVRISPIVRLDPVGPGCVCFRMH